MMENKCPECQHPSLIINLWGFPDEHEVMKLESDGHIVNLQGCVPPEKDEEAFEFECRSCGHKFGEYGDDEYE
mgnify:CR=1 FL=1|jgi:DNA-directed RNA polymerase subunit RPC12/RpoP